MGQALPPAVACERGHVWVMSPRRMWHGAETYAIIMRCGSRVWRATGAPPRVSPVTPARLTKLVRRAAHGAAAEPNVERLPVAESDSRDCGLRAGALLRGVLRPALRAAVCAACADCRVRRVTLCGAVGGR